MRIEQLLVKHKDKYKLYINYNNIKKTINQMEKRLNNKIAEYTSEIKDNIKQKMSELGISGFEQTDKLMQYISDYNRLILTKDDFKKRKRVKNEVPILERFTKNEMEKLLETKWWDWDWQDDKFNK